LKNATEDRLQFIPGYLPSFSLSKACSILSAEAPFSPIGSIWEGVSSTMELQGISKIPISCSVYIDSQGIELVDHDQAVVKLAVVSRGLHLADGQISTWCVFSKYYPL
jgi:hypothetical protein